MSKKPITPIYCVVLWNDFSKYVILHKIFQDKDEALSFGRDLWDHILFQIKKNMIVTVSIIENPKDFDHTYGQLIKAFLIPKED